MPSASKLKILTVVGARPQFIKAAMVSRALAQHRPPAGGPVFEEEILHTGQHYDPMMSQVFFEEMEIPPPAVNLQVGSGNHGEATGAMLAGIEREILARKPDRLLVYGDTTRRWPGPWPRPNFMCRWSTSKPACGPTIAACPKRSTACWSTMFPASLLSFRAGPNEPGAGRHRAAVYVVGDVHVRRGPILPRQSDCAAGAAAFILCTLHRAENTDDAARLRGILAALQERRSPSSCPFTPARGNSPMARASSSAAASACWNRSPTSPCLDISSAREFVVTDSGGVQKEAFFLGKRCITVRDETEWTELVACDANRVVGRRSGRHSPGIFLGHATAGPVSRSLRAGDASQHIVSLLE